MLSYKWLEKEADLLWSKVEEKKLNFFLPPVEAAEGGGGGEMGGILVRPVVVLVRQRVCSSEGFVHFPAGLQLDNCSGGGIKMIDRPP